MGDHQVVEYTAKDNSKIKLTKEIIKKYLVSGRSDFVTDQELVLYAELCKSRGLNPFTRDVFIVKYTQGDSAAIITSIDYYRKRARAQRDCKGWSVGIVIEKGGELIYRKGTILLEGENLVGGWAEGLPEGWAEPMRKEVNLKRYIKKTQQGPPTRFWSVENQPEMIAKVAESQLLRSLWPDEFQGLYVDSEAQSRDAQDELHGAVAAGGSGADHGPTFEQVFAEEIGQTAPGVLNPFMNWIVETCKTYGGSTLEEFKPTLIANAASIKKQWAEKREAYLAEQAAKDDPAVDEKESAGDASADGEGAKEAEEKPKSFRDQWIGLTAKSFGPFVTMEIEKFKALADDEKREAAAKWLEFYGPGFECPFIDKAEGGTDAKGSAGKTVDPEAAEMEALRKELKTLEKKHGRVVLAAKKKTQIFLPSSFDGFRILVDEVNRMIREEK